MSQTTQGMSQITQDIGPKEVMQQILKSVFRIVFVTVLVVSTIFVISLIVATLLRVPFLTFFSSGVRVELVAMDNLTVIGEVVDDNSSGIKLRHVVIPQNMETDKDKPAHIEPLSLADTDIKPTGDMWISRQRIIMTETISSNSKFYQKVMTTDGGK